MASDGIHPSLTILTPPEPVVSLEQAKQHLRVEADDDDVLIATYLAAATQQLDAPHGWLGRAIGVQTIEARAAYFDLPEWTLPCPPVIEVDQISYVDPTGTVQTLDPAVYDVRGNAVVRGYGKSWPAVRVDSESVRVTYQAGYEMVPAPIVAAILLMTGDLYANRETSVTGTIAASIPMETTVINLLAPYRVWA